MKAHPLASRYPQDSHSPTQRHTQLDTHADTGIRAQGRMDLWGYGMGLGGNRTGIPAGHHFLLLLRAVGGEVLGDDVRILEEHITDGLVGTQRVGETRGWAWMGPSRATSEIRDEPKLLLAPKMDHWGWVNSPSRMTIMANGRHH